MNSVADDPRASVRHPVKSSCVNCTANAYCLPGTDRALDSRRVERMVARRSSWELGEHVYRMAQPVIRKLYAIRSGQFKLYQLSAQGVQQVAKFAGPGDVLGLDAIGLAHYRCSAVALCDSILCEFALEPLTARHAVPGRPHDLARILSQVMAREEWLTVQIGHSRAQQRLVAFLLALAPQVAPDTPLCLPLHMTREDIGDFLGMTPSTVSRLLSQLVRDGMLRMELHGVWLLDPSGLQRLARGSAIVPDTACPA